MSGQHVFAFAAAATAAAAAAAAADADVDVERRVLTSAATHCHTPTHLLPALARLSPLYLPVPFP